MRSLILTAVMFGSLPQASADVYFCLDAAPARYRVSGNGNVNFDARPAPTPIADIGQAVAGTCGTPGKILPRPLPVFLQGWLDAFRISHVIDRDGTIHSSTLDHRNLQTLRGYLLLLRDGAVKRDFVVFKDRGLGTGAKSLATLAGVDRAKCQLGCLANHSCTVFVYYDTKQHCEHYALGNNPYLPHTGIIDTKHQTKGSPDTWFGTSTNIR